MEFEFPFHDVSEHRTACKVELAFMAPLFLLKYLFRPTPLQNPLSVAKLSS